MEQNTITLPLRLGNLSSYDGDTGVAFRQVWDGSDNPDHPIARCIGPWCDANAEFIVTACNAHDQLVEGAANMVAEVARLRIERDQLLAACAEFETIVTQHFVQDPAIAPTGDDVGVAMAKFRAAIAAAGAL